MYPNSYISYISFFPTKKKGTPIFLLLDFVISMTVLLDIYWRHDVKRTKVIIVERVSSATSQPSLRRRDERADVRDSAVFSRSTINHRR